MPLLHIGDHSMLSLDALPWHLLEPDHLFFIVMAAIVGLVAYRQGRRAEARARARAQTEDTRHDSR